MNVRRNALVRPACVVLGIAAALVLAGCSSDTAPADGDTVEVDNGTPQDPNDNDAEWDFSNNDAVSKVKTITFTINDDLLDVATDYAENRIFESISVKGLELDGPDFCAVEIEFGFADGVDMDALISDYTAGYPSSSLERIDAVSGLLGFDGLRADKEFGDPDLDNPSDTIWIAEDYSTATKVQDCASQPYDPEAQTVPLAFAAPELVGVSQMYSLPSLGSAELTVMKNGDLTVIDTRVSGFVRDSNGAWITD